MLVLNFEVLGGLECFSVVEVNLCHTFLGGNSFFPCQGRCEDVLQSILSRVPVLVELLHSDFEIKIENLILAFNFNLRKYWMWRLTHLILLCVVRKSSIASPVECHQASIGLLESIIVAMFYVNSFLHLWK
jgi:hypothetical protein